MAYFDSESILYLFLPISFMSFFDSSFYFISCLKVIKFFLKKWVCELILNTLHYLPVKRNNSHKILIHIKMEH